MHCLIIIPILNLAEILCTEYSIEVKVHLQFYLSRLESTSS